VQDVALHCVLKAEEEVWEAKDMAADDLLRRRTEVLDFRVVKGGAVRRVVERGIEECWPGDAPLLFDQVMSDHGTAA
jgi:hypothetical protein